MSPRDTDTFDEDDQFINRKTVMKTIMRNGSLRALLFAGTTAFVGVYAAGAEAGFTMISDGTITAGTDGAGLFGTPGANLAGKTYELAITYSDFTSAFHTTTATLEKEAGQIPGTVSVTINGVTYSANVTASLGAMAYANNNGFGYSALVGFQSGSDSSGNSVYASQDLTSNLGVVTGPRLSGSAYSAVTGDIGSVKFATTTPISAAIPSGTVQATFTGVPTSIRTQGSLPARGDVNGDGVINCTDLNLASSGIGKTSTQPGFVPGADIDGNGVIDIRDIAGISRLLAAGTHC